MVSFVERGHSVKLYSYEAYDLPSGIEARPASAVLDRSLIGRFRTGGKANIAHFTDLFRLLLAQTSDSIWIDADMLCLTDGGEWPETIIIGAAGRSIINCVLRIADRKLLEHLIAGTRSLIDRDLPWAATQNVISKMLESSFRRRLSTMAAYCPINADDWHMLLLPEYTRECREHCAQAQTLHLYHNILQKVGYLKTALPPRGSYLRERLDERGLGRFFVGEYDVETVRSLATNWKLRFSGAELGFGAVVRQAIPSMGRTIERRRFR